MGAATRGVGLAMALWDGANGLGFLVIFLLDFLGTAATNLEPIYWNSLNKRYVGLSFFLKCTLSQK